MKKKCFFSGFTLVELLIVITIIAILAALVLRTASYVQDKAARSRAEGELAALTSALDRYKVDNGEYPSGTNTNGASGGSNYFLFDALCSTNTNSKVYYEFPKNMTNSGTNIIDPWGNTYGYQFPGDTNRNGTNFFDVWSTANKSTNTNAWIKNW